MPALKSLKEQYINGIKVDKINDSVFFNDETHTYYDLQDMGVYVSVSKLIEEFTPKFDEDFFSMYKGLEKITDATAFNRIKSKLLQYKKYSQKTFDILGVTKEQALQAQKEILQEWEEKRKASTDRGTKIHAQIEESFYTKGKHSVEKFGIGGKFDAYEGATKLDKPRGIFPELMLSWKSDDGKLRVCGQADLIVKDNNDIWVVDNKGLPLDTLIPTKQGFTTMKDLRVGDIVFDKNGKLTKVIVKSEIHHNPCYKMYFDNGDEIVSDCDHRWEIYFRKAVGVKAIPTDVYQVLTTKQLKEHLDTHSRDSRFIPKIKNCKPLNMPKINLPIDPYVLGVWLGDGSKSCGIVTQQKDSVLWDEIKRRGYSLGENLVHDESRKNTEERTIYGLRTELNKLHLLNNKHIPDIYYRASYEQRVDLLRGLMDTDGCYHKTRKRFIMATSFEWQQRDLCRLLSTLGIKPTVFNVVKKCDGKSFPGWDVCFSTNTINPFLIRNQDIEFPVKDNWTFRNIIKIEEVETVPTQCIEVDSPTHTYLCTDRYIVTHNTNREISTKAYYNKATKKSEMMLHPLEHLENTTFNHYQLQLSCYFWLLKQSNPDLNLKSLTINHIDHDNNQNIIPCTYLEKEVEMMLKAYKKKCKIRSEMSRLKSPIQ